MTADSAFSQHTLTVSEIEDCTEDTRTEDFRSFQQDPDNFSSGQVCADFSRVSDYPDGPDFFRETQKHWLDFQFLRTVLSAGLKMKRGFWIFTAAKKIVSHKHTSLLQNLTLQTCNVFIVQAPIDITLTPLILYPYNKLSL